MSESDPPDDLTKADLWDELQTLKERIPQPTRRQVLTAAVGAGAFGLGMGTASAASTSDGRHAAKFGQFAQLEDPGGDTWASVPDSGPIDLQGRGLTNMGTINTADASAASQGEVLQKDASGTDLTFGSISSGLTITSSDLGNLTEYQEYEVANDANGSSDYWTIFEQTTATDVVYGTLYATGPISNWEVQFSDGGTWELLGGTGGSTALAVGGDDIGINSIAVVKDVYGLRVGTGSSSANASWLVITLDNQ